ncbi:MAG: hypothetical protein ACXABY_30575 [Candidatus Thorarchaeota archaeon]
MERETWKVFRVKCGKCDSTVTTRHRNDWSRCQCCSVYVWGNDPPAIGGDPSVALTLDNKPYYGQCKADIFCANRAINGKGRCVDHLEVKEDDEHYTFY